MRVCTRVLASRLRLVDRVLKCVCARTRTYFQTRREPKIDRTAWQSRFTLRMGVKDAQASPCSMCLTPPNVAGTGGEFTCCRQAGDDGSSVLKPYFEYLDGSPLCEADFWIAPSSCDEYGTFHVWDPACAGFGVYEPERYPGQMRGFHCERGYYSVAWCHTHAGVGAHQCVSYKSGMGLISRPCDYDIRLENSHESPHLILCDDGKVIRDVDAGSSFNWELAQEKYEVAQVVATGWPWGTQQLLLATDLFDTLQLSGLEAAQWSPEYTAVNFHSYPSSAQCSTTLAHSESAGGSVEVTASGGVRVKDCSAGDVCSMKRFLLTRKCHAGSYAPLKMTKSSGATTACLPCAADPGSYCPPGSSASAGQKCPVDYYCTGGDADKQPCADGSYAPKTGASACTQCEAGTMATETKSCSVCKKGLKNPDAVAG